MNQRSKTRIVSAAAVLLLATSCYVFTRASHQPQPGRHQWLLSVAGESSISISGTDYDLVKAPDGSDTFVLIRWDKYHGHDIQREMVRGITRYSKHTSVLALATLTGVTMIDIRTDRIYGGDELAQLDISAEERNGLIAELSYPIMSRYWEYCTIGGILLLTFALCVLYLIKLEVRRRRQLQ